MTIEKEEKPKKVFTITIDVYDSGDSEASMVEYRKSPSGLGRPKAWQLTNVDFVKRVEEVLGDYTSLLSDWNQLIGKDAKALAAFGNSSKVEIKSVDVKKPESKKDTLSKKDDEDDDLKDVNFGEFDPDKQ